MLKYKELKFFYLFIPINTLNEESKSIIPGQKHILEDSLYTFLFEAQIVGSNNWRVDKIQPKHERYFIYESF